MFFTDGKLRGLEKFMQLPKYPTKKGGGKYRSSYNYTKGDCNCVNCLHWKKKYGCSQKVCPYIQERIDCGACSFDEILHVAFIDVNSKKLKNRINLYVKESKTMNVKFRNDKHKELFYKTIEGKYKTNNAFMSAVYLMTADIFLWKQVCLNVGMKEILFDKIRLKKSTPESYALYCAAKDLYLGTEHISMCDLTDDEIIPKKVFELICNAVAIRRFGIGILDCN